MQKQPFFHIKTLLAVAMILLAAILVLLPVSCQNVASADNATYRVLFPTGNYFQSSSPSLVGANRNYLVIYDDLSKTLFVRADEEWTYTLDFESVSGIFVVENVVFLHADNKYFTLDLTDKAATARERTLPSPADVTFFNSDGTYLYAHSAAGRLTVYDKDLQVALGIDNLYDPDTLAGKIVVAGEGANLIVFSTEYASPVFITYDATTKAKTIKGITHHIGEAYVGDVVYALEIIQQSSASGAQKRIVCIDKTSGDLLFATDINPDKFFAFGNRLFTIQDGGVTVYALNDEHTALTKTQTITMSGNDLRHLSNPTDVTRFQNETVVADSGNNRIAFISPSGVMTALQLDETPLALCSGDSLYAVTKSKILQIKDKTITSTIDVQDVVDVTYLSSLYILKKDGVYVNLAGNAVKIFDVDNAKRITAANDGTNVYVLTESEIIAINRSGQHLLSLASGDFKDAIDFAVDYQGKAFVAYANRIDYVLGEESGSYTLSNPSLKATPTSVCLDGTTVFFTASECFVGALDVQAATKQNYAFTAPEITNSAYHFAKAKDGAMFFSIDGRIENVSLATNETIIVYDDTTKDGKTLARVGERLISIDKSQFDSVECGALSGDYVTKGATSLFALPYVEDGKITLESGVRLTLKSDTAEYDSSVWVIATYQGQEYFVKRSDVAEYVEIVEEKDKVYGKANADRVGGLVNMYADQSTDSEVVAQIVDGSKVEVLETLDDFYLVSYDGKLGYIQKSQLKIGTLTTVQIVAIVLSIIVAIAGAAIFASVYMTRKNADAKKKEQDQKRF